MRVEKLKYLVLGFEGEARVLAWFCAEGLVFDFVLGKARSAEHIRIGPGSRLWGSEWPASPPFPMDSGLSVMSSVPEVKRRALPSR